MAREPVVSANGIEPAVVVANGDGAEVKGEVALVQRSTGVNRIRGVVSTKTAHLISGPPPVLLPWLRHDPHTF